MLLKVRLPTLSDYHPLVMSIAELKQHVEGHITFSKQDVFQNLGSTTAEARSWDMGSHKGTLSPHPPLPMLETQSQGPWKPRGQLIPPLCHPDVHPKMRPHQQNLPPCMPRLMSRVLCLALQELHLEVTPWYLWPKLTPRP